MRPAVLNPLFAPVSTLPGVGPKTAKLLTRLLKGGEETEEARLLDLLLHLPTAVIDRRHMPNVAEAEPGTVVTLKLTIDEHLPPRPGNARIPYRIRAHDESGPILLVYFNVNARQGRLGTLCPPGSVRFVSGKLELYGDMAQMAHPDYVVGPEELASVPRIEPVYPLAAGLSGRLVSKAVRAALQRVPDLPEWVDPPLLARENWPSIRESLTAVHAPGDASSLDPSSPARRRLAYDELLAGQLALALVRQGSRRLRGRPIRSAGVLREKIAQALPFELTGSQRAAIGDIIGDLAAEQRMLRLLQGDVGSGKTVVALMAMATAVEAGGQAALMAPTEILVRQHHRTIAPLAEAAGIRIALLTGRERGRDRESVLEGLRNGSIQLAVGTHALFQEEVEFRDLLLAVVDEQHRFGVHQRLALAGKGEGIDLLVMTATPIPRTLELTFFGEMDVSRLTEKPAGRAPIDTRILPTERIEEVVAAVGRAVESGARVYWICPMVDESEAVDLAAAEARSAFLRELFGHRVALVHGRMSGREKDEAMTRFLSGEAAILVATTVIEVGVDVPEATVIIIEHAERFGLAQLHQLRGRVGRGSRRSACLLLYKAPLGPIARARLTILRDTDDGFRIAEEDLRLRGAGDLLGTRQSGLPSMKLADLSQHGPLLEMARDDARLVLDRDSRLTSARGEALRLLLALFGKRQAIRLLQAG